jgi:threonine/homoserine/homoserine lactone efflux protein
MIDQTTLLTYLAVLTGFVFLPGPAVLLTLARSASFGPKVGIATGLGIATGDLAHTMMAVFGLSAILAASALLFSLIKYAGAAYLIYLGIRAIFEKTEIGSFMRSPAITAAKAYRQAVIAELLNPKSALFFLAFLPQFVHPGNGTIPVQLALLGILFVVTGAVSSIAYALAGGSINRFLQRNAFIGRWQGKVVGGIYCALGVRLALQER